MATRQPSLAHLAHAAAARIGLTARRWWRDATDPTVLHVEVERRLIGAPPALAELTVALPPQETPRPARSRRNASSPRPRVSSRRTRPALAGRRRARPNT